MITFHNDDLYFLYFLLRDENLSAEGFLDERHEERKIYGKYDLYDRIMACLYGSTVIFDGEAFHLNRQNGIRILYLIVFRNGRLKCNEFDTKKLYKL